MQAPEHTGESARVVLLHGIWMRSPVMWALGRRLSAAGFKTRYLDYASVFGTPSQAIARLRQLLCEDSATTHLVGHSLGGLLALAACANPAQLPAGRIVCLGSPLRGSAGAAAAAARLSAGRLLGGFRELLLHGVPLPADREVGVIAGRRPRGVGALFAQLPTPHDGTVAVRETLVDGLHDHCVVDASHSGLLLDRVVARAVTQFLRDGRFSAAA